MCYICFQGTRFDVARLAGSSSRLPGGRRPEDLRVVRPQVQEPPQVQSKTHVGKDQQD